MLRRLRRDEGKGTTPLVAIPNKMTIWIAFDREFTSRSLPAKALRRCLLTEVSSLSEATTGCESHPTVPPIAKLLPFHLDTSMTNAACTHDITHDWVPQHQSWNDGAMDGFVTSHLP